MNKPWDFIGIRRDPAVRKHPQQDSAIMWRIPFIGRGAICSNGCGHWRILGLWYHWHDRSHFGYSKERVLHVWRLFCIAHEERNDLKRSYRKSWTATFAELQWPIRGVR